MIALGSLTAVLSFAVPSLGAFAGETVNSAFGISPAIEAATGITIGPAIVTLANALSGSGSVAVSQTPWNKDVH